MSATMIGRLRKIKKEHLLKRPKAVSKNTKFGPKYKWFKISYLECFFWKFYFGPTTFLYFSRRSNGHHQSYFRFSSRKSQSQQKLAKKTTHFTIQFCSKNLTHFTNHNSLDIENNMLPQHSQKPFWLCKFSSKVVSVWCQKKTFALHHFSTPKNCILEALRKEMSSYFCISL